MKSIYITCPAATYTGGPTLAHQLCYILNSKGYHASMWYQVSPLLKKGTDYVHSEYKQYNNPYVTKKPKDNEDTIIISLETTVGLLNGFKKAKRYIWWMSVDNYYHKMETLLDKIKRVYFHKSFPIEYRKRLENKRKYRVILDKDITHLIQSEYARLFLLSKNISEDSILPLSDYIEDSIVEESKKESKGKRSDKKVLYNPKKGYAFTQELIKYMPEIEWTPLINMNKEQVINELKSSKLYIDFGEHPGKDRFPREAVLLGSAIITGKKGAAKNNVDVPISDEFKFDDDIKLLPNIKTKIHEVLDNYDSIITKFSDFKKEIQNEKEVFNQEIDNAFGFALKS